MSNGPTHCHTRGGATRTGPDWLNSGHALGTPSMPVVADRAAFDAALSAVRDREKAHTREGDAIAAARRRLPMVEVDATTRSSGPTGR